VSIHPRQAPDLDVTETEDGLVVFVPSTRGVHHLNVTATLVFELCTGEHDEEAIAAIVQRAFHLDEVPLDDVRSALTSLRSGGVVV